MADIIRQEHIDELVINHIPSVEIYEEMKAAGQIEPNEIYMVDGGVTAADVTYDSTESGLTAEDVQGAIDELAEMSVPTVTSADNGKFLRAVNGEAAWVSVPVMEGGSY